MIEITARDTASGEFEATEISEDQYLLLHGYGRQVSSVRKYANGTHIITVKKTQQGAAS